MVSSKDMKEVTIVDIGNIKTGVTLSDIGGSEKKVRARVNAGWNKWEEA